MQRAMSAHLPRVLACLACEYVRSRTRDPWLVGLAGEFVCAIVDEQYVLGAARGGHAGILRTLRMRRALWDLVLCEACAAGNIHVARLAIARGAACVNQALFHACRNEQLQAAAMLLARGATNALDCLRTACLWGKFDAARLMMEHGASDNQFMERAVAMGHTHFSAFTSK
jgi:hypothetical protein